MFVTINGADTGDTKGMGWDRVIRPLCEGSYDVDAFLKMFREIGYKGPIRFQGYGIKANSADVLARTMTEWRKTL